jgi:hypothetical protein
VTKQESFPTWEYNLGRAFRSLSVYRLNCWYFLGEKGAVQLAVPQRLHRKQFRMLEWLNTVEVSRGLDVPSPKLGSLPYDSTLRC